MTDDLLRKVVRRLSGGIFGAALLNGFVYEACLRARVRRPDIPVRAVELYGQCGEDLIVRSLLEAKALSDGADLSRQKYLEIGGNHPFATSGTYLLNASLGMSGVIVEANPKLIADLEKGRPSDVIVHAAIQTEALETVKLSVSNQSELSSIDRTFVQQWNNGEVGEASWIDVPALRINDLVRTHFDDRDPAYMSIDVEGLDLDLLRDFDFVLCRPWLVQAEPSDHHHRQNSDRMIDHMDSVDYELVARTAVNLIFRDRRTVRWAA